MKLIQDDLDTSNFAESGSKNHYSSDHFLYSTKNKKVIGRFKDELGGRIMSELVFLRSKAYAYLVENKDVKKLKGIIKTTINKSLTFDDYKNVLIKPYININYHKMFLLNSDKHEMFVKEVNKNQYHHLMINDGFIMMELKHFHTVMMDYAFINL